MVERIFGGRVSRQTAGLLSVMAANSRMELLRPATARFAELLDERKGKVRVEVTTAFTLSQSQIEKITETLRNVLGAEPVVQNKVDGEVIGGMVLKLGDKVYDASLAAELDRLRRDMRRESKGRPTSKANGQ